MSTYRRPIVDNIPPQLVDSKFWGDIRLETNSNGNYQYIGTHVTKGISTSDTNWKVLKVSYMGTSSNAERIQTAYGMWDQRGSLF